MRVSSVHLLLAGLCLNAVVVPVRAAVPDDAAGRAKAVGQPTALLVQPETVALTGPRAKQQVVVSGKYADGSVRDLTAFAELSVEGDVASLFEGGYLTPKKNGAGDRKSVG